jgi:hypothetical protein
LRTALDVTNVDVTLSVGRGDHDIDRGRGLSLASWLNEENDEDRGGITRLSANVIAEDSDKAEWLNLFEAQMGAKEQLDLPDDNPERSYTARLSYARRVMREHEAAIREQDD